MKASTEEERINQEIRRVYNSGDCRGAVTLACEFFARFPESPLAKYNYAVMHGDYAWVPGHSEQDKERFLEIAKQGISELFHDSKFSEWSDEFQTTVRNEYYWFFELPEQQYSLGIERIQLGQNGHYSACVGASMLAYNLLKQSKIEEAEEWANKAIIHFSEFEKLVPHWYNINYFGAQSLACLGKFEEAISCFKAMYLKQHSPENTNEMDEFIQKVEEIKILRKR